MTCKKHSFGPILHTKNSTHKHCRDCGEWVVIRRDKKIVEYYKPYHMNKPYKTKRYGYVPS